jgi:hypothetical protein
MVLFKILKQYIKEKYMNKKFKFLLVSLSLAAVTGSTTLVVTSCGDKEKEKVVQKTEQEIWLEPFILNVGGENKKQDIENIKKYINEGTLKYEEEDFTDVQAKQIAKGVVLYNSYMNNGEGQKEYKGLYNMALTLIQDMFPENNGDKSEQLNAKKKLILGMMVFESFYTNTGNKELKEPKDLDIMLPAVSNILSSVVPIINVVNPDFTKETWVNDLYSSIKDQIKDEKTKTLIKNITTIVSYLTQENSSVNKETFNASINSIIKSFDVEIPQNIEDQIPSILEQLTKGSFSTLEKVKTLLTTGTIKNLINLVKGIDLLPAVVKPIAEFLNKENITDAITNINTLMGYKLEQMGYSIVEGQTWDSLLMARIGQIADKLLEELNK